jgi:hypothetical protein
MPNHRDSTRTSDAAARRWFLAAHELGRVTASDETRERRDGWTTGDVVPLIDGAAYFRRLIQLVADLRAGDEVYFADWRSDADEQLTPQGPTFAEPVWPVWPVWPVVGSPSAVWCGVRTPTSFG